MNTRRNAGRGRGEIAAVGNQVPPLAPATGVAMPVNQTGLTDAEVRTALAQMAQAITVQAQAKMAQTNRHEVQREKPLAHNIANRLRDFTRMNPPIFTGSKTAEDPQEFVEEDSRALGGGPITWELFKTTFLQRFFPREMKEAKVEEFINLKQGSMTVREYSLKFVKLSRYATSLVSNNRDEVEDSRKKRRVHEVRRPKPSDQAGSSSGGGRSTFGVCDQPRFKKGHQSSENSNSQRSAAPRGGRPEPKKGDGGDVQCPKKECGKCGHINSGECRLGPNACFDCGKSGHMVKDCPQNRGQAGGNAQPRPNPQNAAAAEPPKRNRFYALKGRE
ncbi:uncharacterized protein LOC107003698 [Solanum pennellii]|uniref:Uncharacterized protein LOC107003698 n=1 Tax=Solanum pennellii TaxID=28526 RepID=A0ABM1FIW7_SOLPN|nr:uncharacterized protein LOC107003698 [Solanum pennellii]